MIEDPLRLIRAIRFSGVLGFSLDSRLKNILKFDEFHDADEDTLVDRYKTLDLKPSELIKGIARERVCVELTKLFKDYPIQGCAMFAGVTSKDLYDYQFDHSIHPDISKAIFGDDIWLKPTMEKRK